MKAKFIKLRLHNFFSFEDTTIDLNDMGTILVNGRNFCKLDNAFSNGSGKSSIFNGICYALTGETAQGVSNGIENIFTNPEDCWVELTMMVDSDEFVITRIKTPRPDMKIVINGEDRSGKGIRESSKLLASYLPDITPELVGSVIVLGQGLPHRFSNNNPAGRKEILEKLTKSDFMIQSIKDKLDQRQTQLKEDLRNKEDYKLAKESELKVYSAQLEKLNNELTEYSQHSESEITDLEKDVDEITYRVEEYNKECAIAEKNLEELNNSISYIMTTRDTELSKISSKYDIDIQKHTQEEYSIKADIKTVKNEIKKLESVSDICPTCGQKIPDIIKPDTSAQKEELENLQKRLDETSKIISNLTEEKESQVNCSKEVCTMKLNETDSRVQKTSKELKEIKSEVTKLLNDKQYKLEKLLELKNLRDNHKKLKKEAADISEEVSKLEKLVTEASFEIIDLNSHLDVVQQLITLAKREFRGVLLSNIIEFINKKIKQYSMQVFDNNKLDFRLNENCIDIIYCDKLYENLSGGERQKIDIIVQLALRDILSKQLGIHVNILVLDEILDNIDAIGAERIMNIISGLSDIESIFFITHHNDSLNMSYDNTLLVEKNENGVSHISFV